MTTETFYRIDGWDRYARQWNSDVIGEDITAETLDDAQDIVAGLRQAFRDEPVPPRYRITAVAGDDEYIVAQDADVW